MRYLKITPLLAFNIAINLPGQINRLTVAMPRIFVQLYGSQSRTVFQTTLRQELQFVWVQSTVLCKIWNSILFLYQNEELPNFWVFEIIICFYFKGSRDLNNTYSFSKLPIGSKTPASISFKTLLFSSNVLTPISPTNVSFPIAVRLLENSINLRSLCCLVNRPFGISVIEFCPKCNSSSANKFSNAFRSIDRIRFSERSRCNKDVKLLSKWREISDKRLSRILSTSKRSRLTNATSEIFAE